MNSILLDDGVTYAPLFNGEPFPYYYRYEGYMVHTVSQAPSNIRQGYGLILLTFYRNGGVTKEHSIGAYPLAFKKVITNLIIDKILKIAWHDLKNADLLELATLELIKGN